MRPERFRHLFLDLHDITRMERLHRRVHQPARHAANPVLTGENPWERFASLYGTVLYDEREKLFRMWYLTGPQADGMVRVRGRKALGNITLLGYAVSRDGLRWEKPILGQLDLEGSTANNLVDVGRTNCEGFAALLDEDDPDPGRRFKALYWEHGGVDTFVTHADGRLLWGEGKGDGMWVSFSPDGVQWTGCPENPVIPLGSDTTQSLVVDPRTGAYVAFGRFGAGGRKVARAESADCVHWSEPRLVFECDGSDEEGTQFYGMPLAIYEGLYLGMPWIYREGVDGTIDTSLAVSRDGVRWERVLDRQTFLSLGPEGTWEDGMARISQSFITVGEEIFLYYCGVQGPHTGRKLRTVTRTHKTAIGLARIRRDGFVSLDAGAEEGALLTKPMIVPAGDLHANLSPRSGFVAATVTDTEGRAIAGFEASRRLTADSLDAVFAFDRPPRELAGRMVRLRFTVREASLYSYWFT